MLLTRLMHLARLVRFYSIATDSMTAYPRCRHAIAMFAQATQAACNLTGGGVAEEWRRSGGGVIAY